jgi:hypothetical protein
MDYLTQNGQMENYKTRRNMKLTKKQKKLPKGLQMAIMKKKKKTKKRK